MAKPANARQMLTSISRSSYPLLVTRQNASATAVAAEMVYWERPGGGSVFHAGSINAGSMLALDPKWSGLLKNVLSHFGVPPR